MIQPINNYYSYQYNSPYVNNTVYLMPAKYQGKNYLEFNKEKVDFFVNQGERALPYLNQIILNSYNEYQLTETLYILDRMLEKGTKNIDKMYYSLSRLNNTNSPYIQTFLAGIYRKTQIPDAFGPLVSMLIKNSFKTDTPANFDPNEEIGGAILSYISDKFRNQS